MSNASHALLHRVLEKATGELFLAQGVALRPGASTAAALPPTSTLAGVVGFTGETMRGMLIVASTFELFARTRPPEVQKRALSPDVGQDWVVLRDWAAEMANQLMGRVKNDLFSYGLKLRVSTPGALSGKELSVAAPASGRATPMPFSSDDGDLWVWWDAVMDVELSLVHDEQAESAAREGDVILF